MLLTLSVYLFIVICSSLVTPCASIPSGRELSRELSKRANDTLTAPIIAVPSEHWCVYYCDLDEFTTNVFWSGKEMMEGGRHLRSV